MRKKDQNPAPLINCNAQTISSKSPSRPKEPRPDRPQPPQDGPHKPPAGPNPAFGRQVPGVRKGSGGLGRVGFCLKGRNGQQQPLCDEEVAFRKGHAGPLQHPHHPRPQGKGQLPGYQRLRTLRHQQDPPALETVGVHSDGPAAADCGGLALEVQVLIGFSSLII